MKELKIAYIGGGSKNWARSLMQDLALAEGIGGQVRLYDIDVNMARKNQRIAARIHSLPQAVAPFAYTVAGSLEECLEGADFVLISILPGTFREMHSDVHAPEAYGIIQSVGDTAGPGGVLRAMRTVPIYEQFARAIREHCPDAWVLNLTNPMAACVKTLYHVFPQIKAFGCCHEVFHAQDFLCSVLREQRGISANRRDIYTDASGINHFTWITQARYHSIDLLALLPEFMERYFESGYAADGKHDAWKVDPFACGNRVKMDLFRRYGALAAAGDRHLVEFLNNDWYLADRETVDAWHFALTSVEFRERMQEQQIEKTLAMAEGSREVTLAPSGEELVRLLRALAGLDTVVSNVNVPNHGQMPGIPDGVIVETNCVFTGDTVKPVTAGPLPAGALALVRRNADNTELLCQGIFERDSHKILAAFMNQPLCSRLRWQEGERLLGQMRENTRAYLEPYGL